MLSYISQKFSQETCTHVNEPRAALFLNRFSRTLAIMYATNGLADVLGISNDRLIGKSFYYCIQENCLREAVKCLESAKANDSIAYLRFWFRDPTQDSERDPDEPMSDVHSVDDDDGGVHLAELMENDEYEQGFINGTSHSLRSSAEPRSSVSRSMDPNSRSPSGNSTDLENNASEALFDQPAGAQSSSSSISTPDDSQVQRPDWNFEPRQIELEAVVSCTSDGLVVVLRAARPFIPHTHQPVSGPVKSPYANGFFASPWASNPIIPDQEKRSTPLPNPIQPSRFPTHPTAAQANTAATTGPVSEDFMNSIREVAVFAWSLVGINGSLVKYGRGTPSGESQPSSGLPVWDPNSNAGPERSSARTFVPNGYNYSPIDGSPIYDPMQVDGNLLRNQPNGLGTGGRFASSALHNGSNDLSPTQNVFADQNRPDQHSRFQNTVSVNDFAMGIPNGQIRAPKNANGLTSYSAHGDSDHHPLHTDSNFAKRSPQTSGGQTPGQIYQNGDHTIEYDPYAPRNYQTASTGINGSFTQHDDNGQTIPKDRVWNFANAAQEQSVSGTSRWS